MLLVWVLKLCIVVWVCMGTDALFGFQGTRKCCVSYHGNMEVHDEAVRKDDVSFGNSGRHG